MKRFVLALFILIGVAGCSVGSGQWNMLRRTVPALLPTETNRAAKEATKYAWEFRFNDMQFIVYPVAGAGERLTFASPSGLRLEWDGNTIHTIENFPGAFGPFKAGIAGQRRWYDRDGYGVLWVDCTPKRDWQLTPTRAGWRQECSGRLGSRAVKTMHSIERGPTGKLKLIEMTLWPTVPPATLRPIGELARAD